MRLTVGNLYGQNQLIVENVQGTFSTGVIDNILYRNNSGVTTSLNCPGPVNPNEIETVTDGLHFTVFHRNHGLHATGNVVNISGIEPDGKPTLLTDEYSVTAQLILVFLTHRLQKTSVCLRISVLVLLILDMSRLVLRLSSTLV